MAENHLRLSHCKTDTCCRLVPAFCHIDLYARLGCRGPVGQLVPESVQVSDVSKETSIRPPRESSLGANDSIDCIGPYPWGI